MRRVMKVLSLVLPVFLMREILSLLEVQKIDLVESVSTAPVSSKTDTCASSYESFKFRIFCTFFVLRSTPSINLTFCDAFSMRDPLQRQIVSRACQRRLYHRTRTIVRRVMKGLSFVLSVFPMREILSLFD